MGLAVLSLGASIVLTDPDPATLPLRARRWLAARSWRSSSPPPVAPTRSPRSRSRPSRTSRSTTAAMRRPSASRSRSPTRRRWRRFGTRSWGGAAGGSRTWRASSPACRPAIRRPRRRRPTSTCSSARCWMYEGEWAEASEHFARAQTADPARPALFRAKLDALRGVAALRRGEIENCVACCNESSCIFPLAAAAVHRRTAGSREAIEHFTRYLRQRPEDLGVRWLLNVAYMTLGEYPERCSRRVPAAAGPVCRAGRRPAPDGQRGRPRRAQRAGRIDGRRVPGRRLQRRRPPRRLHAHDRPRAGGAVAAQPRRRHLRGRLRLGRPGRPGPVAERLPRRLRQRRRPRRPDAPRRLGGPAAAVAACATAAASSRTSPWPPAWASRSPRRRPAGPTTTTTATSTSTSPASSTPSSPDPRNRGRLYHNRGDGTFDDVADRGRRDQRPVRQGGGLGRLRRRRPARPLRLQPGPGQSALSQSRRRHVRRRRRRARASPSRSTASPAGSGTTTTTAGSTSGSTPTARRSRRSSATSSAGRRPASGPASIATSAGRNRFAT